MSLEVINTSSLKDNSGYIITYTGRKFRALDPQPEDIHIKDIAHGLAMSCRWAGQCTHYYSVAEHSVGVAENCPDNLRLTGLLHDAAEAYIGDVPRPFKSAISNYREIEESIMQVIAEKYGLNLNNYGPVKAVDNRMLHTEAAILMPEYDWLNPNMVYTQHKIMCLSPQQSEELFLRAFSSLFYKR